MRILVTGGAGFIGSHVVDALLREGHAVAVVDNLSTGSAANLNSAACFYQADICDGDALARIFADFRPEIVNHHAAQINVCRSVVDPTFDAQVNILGSLQLLAAARAHGVEKIVYASTGGAIYGEPRYLPADEQHPVQPIAPYGVSKLTVEHYLYVYSGNYGVKYTVLRYANVYGPRQNMHGEAGVIALFIGKMLAGEQPKIFGSGEAVRDYVFVADVVAANLLALHAGNGAIVNIGTAVGTSVNALYALLAQDIGFALPPIYAEKRAGEVECSYLANGLAAEVLGWKPTVSVAEGIKRTVEYAGQHV